MTRHFLFCLLSIVLPFSGFSQAGSGAAGEGIGTVSIIPKPEKIQQLVKGNFIINQETKLYQGSDRATEAVSFLSDYIRGYYGTTLLRGEAMGSGVSFVLDLTSTASKPGSYLLDVNENGIVIKSNNAEGFFYGVQSLIQLFPVPDTTDDIGTFRDQVLSNGLAIPFVSIKDAPRFAYRGMHLDVARHFFPVSFVKRYIDFLALHKMNYFHWHLTDDQGWRIEIKKYPLLTSVGGYRNGTIIGHHPGTGSDNTPYGGYYTQDDIRTIVNYAAKRFITVVPEIEMPGHASAAIAAYPKLSCFPDSATVIPGPASNAGNQEQKKKVQETWGVFEDVFCPSEYTFHFLEDVLAEVVQLFPSKYIHIGGDECPKDAWKKSAFCKTLMKEKGLKDDHQLQSYFIRRMEKYLNSKGRNIIGWDEILEGGLAPNATVMSWRGEEGGIAAAKLNHNVIMTPGGYMYFDHSQSKKEDSLTFGGFTTIQKVYSYEPVPKDLEASKAKYIMGAQANLWSEYLGSEKKVEYQLFPRLSALSEVVWSSKGTRDWAEFEPRLLQQMKRYRLWNAAYSLAVFNPENK